MNALQMRRINRRALLLGIGAATAVMSTRSLAGNPVTSDAVASLDAGDTVVPYHVNIPQDALDDLRARLSNVRLPEAET
ncbi:hypothetical protein HJA87_15855 [Rhizobium bangladeshense]|uniref:Uncharacterized protein n=1 Tax=Rhizobium bangladeshense TaxID=1138189 RepID=A0ABS7LIM2_9HYPH|nr:hypothetical protein [Rhizobium bangladeshense]MBY3591332.1 hypothetical protein [Rhizobium bangladeshense]